MILTNPCRKNTFTYRKTYALQKIMCSGPTKVTLVSLSEGLGIVSI